MVRPQRQCHHLERLRPGLASHVVPDPAVRRCPGMPPPSSTPLPCWKPPSASSCSSCGPRPTGSRRSTCARTASVTPTSGVSLAAPNCWRRTRRACSALHRTQRLTVADEIAADASERADAIRVVSSGDDPDSERSRAWQMCEVTPIPAQRPDWPASRGSGRLAGALVGPGPRPRGAVGRPRPTGADRAARRRLRGARRASRRTRRPAPGPPCRPPRHPRCPNLARTDRNAIAIRRRVSELEEIVADPLSPPIRHAREQHEPGRLRAVLDAHAHGKEPAAS